jgi:gliding motility-associated transport system permease protein
MSARQLLGGLGTVWLIARRELAAYFASLSGYVIVAAYLLISGLLFNAFAVGNEPRLSQEVLEQFFYFSSGMAIVSGILLAMRLIAEERQTHTLVLLRTAPVSERQVVWGKFLSATIFLALTLLLSLYMPALIFLHGKVSLLQIATGYLGLLLIGASCISITLLASVWSPTQLIAGVLGGLMVALILICWLLGRVTEEPLKQFFVYVALHNVHFRTFSTGTLHLRDVVYYLGLIVFFLEAATRSLAAWRWRE